MNKYILLYLTLICTTSIHALWYPQTAEVVDSGPSVKTGLYSSITVDSKNNLHVSYYDETNGDLMYAKHNGTTWTIQRIDTTDKVGEYTSITVDSSDNPHITYYDGTGGDLMYIKFNGTSWEKVRVDSTDTVGQYNTLVLDSSGNPHILYRNTTNGNLKYAKYSPSTGWSFQIISSQGGPGTLKLAPNNRPDIIHSTNQNQVIYTWWTGYTWGTYTVETQSSAYPDFVIQPDDTILGTLHIVYCTSLPTTKIRYKKLVNFIIETDQVIESFSDGGWVVPSKIVQDYKNNLHVIYSSGTTLRYAVSVDGGQNWKVDSIYDAVNTSRVNYDITVDTHNVVHISDYHLSGLEHIRGYSQPELVWTGEPGYTTNAVEPDSGYDRATFTFRIKYQHYDSTSIVPGYPKIYILQGQTTAQIVDTQIMDYVSGSPLPTVGSIYSKNILLPQCSYYNYLIEVKDNLPDNYIGVRTNSITVPGPDVGYKISGTVTNPDGTPFPSATVKAVGPSTVVNSTRTAVITASSYEIPVTAFNTWTVTVSSQPSSGANFSFVLTQSVIYANSDKTLNFQRTNTNPTLSLTGEPGYITDGVSPDVTVSSTPVTFRVKYTDTENDSPRTGYPKVVIKKGVDIISNIIMNYVSSDSVSGNYSTGIVYSTTTLLPACSYYSYTFEAYDMFSTSATTFLSYSGPDVKAIIYGMVTYPDGTPMANVSVSLEVITSQNSSTQTLVTDYTGTYYFTGLNTGVNYTLNVSSLTYYQFIPIQRTFTPLLDTTVQNFVRINRSSITWTGEPGYVTDGLEPELVLTTYTILTYKIRYMDADNDPPAPGYPQLVVLKSGTTVQTFTLLETDTTDVTYLDGKTYSVQPTIVPDKGYTYYFISKDTFAVITAFFTVQTETKAGPVFVALTAPSVPENRTVLTDGKDNTTVTSHIKLVWYSTDPDPNSIITYTLYFGDSTDNLRVLYIGTGSEYTLYNLESGKTFYWQVGAKDDTSLTTLSPVYSFRTVSIDETKVFNYPNPFNPGNGGTTNVVFYADKDGVAELIVYSEFGEKLFADSIPVKKGSNIYPYSGRDYTDTVLGPGTYIVAVKVDGKTKKSVILVLKK